ncbi:MAG: hypothetical protein HOP33_07055 [Verrucomicrobia bacterium]|nr:hypothetical protein [Verrucomicrobiota bacterium]
MEAKPSGKLRDGDQCKVTGGVHGGKTGHVTITVIAVATVAAAAVVWFWALRPLGFASYLSSTGVTEADIIRQYWPHRLVEPEWISATPDRFDRLMKWHIYETLARLSVVGVLWFIIAGGAVYRFVRGRRLRPDKGAASNPAIASRLQSSALVGRVVELGS